ncbi:hypothetical protein C4D60_Mb07t19420 [Musa balbisiana]|uniref:WRKY domain-containing protein n=1 Tax=Musa balbisiana TaxID=52838 RepID=A0A4S8JGQ3_MUSBA|nr:hypothetical protein C4D60_Mb07t19420 [Musa balbisiana]
MMSCGNEAKRMKVGDGCRIGFRTKSEVEILDDGFKWRKYGKKSVKNSPNPRYVHSSLEPNQYYVAEVNCSTYVVCDRDREDPRFVITIYEGVHNHISPCTLCHDYAHLPLAPLASAPRGRAMAGAPTISSSWAVQPAQWLESFFQDDM